MSRFICFYLWIITNTLSFNRIIYFCYCTLKAKLLAPFITGSNKKRWEGGGDILSHAPLRWFKNSTLGYKADAFKGCLKNWQPRGWHWANHPFY